MIRPASNPYYGTWLYTESRTWCDDIRALMNDALAAMPRNFGETLKPAEYSLSKLFFGGKRNPRRR